ncbi:early nodulin-20-like [Acanthopagrus latus]|uniref:early nodulin-20-like n=1 Tax=Acanthopagrus latus TaxID=8177 RepID=UPI00187CFA55|nr:early nodulin-20-like [Acanthopagrus latus]
MICVSSPDESVCEMSSMNQCEDREEGGPPSKTPGPGPEPGPEPSCVSIKSLINFFEVQLPPAVKRRPASTGPGPEPGPGPGTGPGPGPEPSCVSFKSDWSKDDVMNFKPEPSSDRQVDQESSEVPRGPSVQQHQTHLDSIFMVCT